MSRVAASTRVWIVARERLCRRVAPVRAPRQGFGFGSPHASQRVRPEVAGALTGSAKCGFRPGFRFPRYTRAPAARLVSQGTASWSPRRYIVSGDAARTYTKETTMNADNGMRELRA